MDGESRQFSVGKVVIVFRIMPSARTWMKMMANVFVLVEGNRLLVLQVCAVILHDRYVSGSLHDETLQN